MSILQSLKLFTTGVGLVSSTSVWLFDSKQLSTPPSSNHSPLINSYSPASRLESRVGKNLVDEKIQINSRNSSSVTFTIKGEESKGNISISSISNPIENFSIGWVYATENDYRDFRKEDIQINLFTKSAWYSEGNVDEYGRALTKEEVLGLFEGELDEVKVKQLLLSLHKRMEWLLLSHNNYYSQQTWPNVLDDLKNLKIKYFRDFNSLKDYVKEKVTSCTEEERACVPSMEELDSMDTDLASYFRVG